MSQVFLSYARDDADFAAKLRKALTDRGAKAFDAPKDVQPGVDYWTSIQDQLRRSDLVVFVVPRHEGQGKSALIELGAAKALGRRIVAVLPDRIRTSNSEIASSLGNTYFLDSTGKNVGELADQVLSDLAAA
jgi:hypothetical protein